MTYGTSHLLIGWGEFSGGGSKQILLCKEGGGSIFMKNKNIGGCVLSTQPDQLKRPQCKNAQKMQKIIKNLKFFPRSFRSLGILQDSYFWSN